MEQVYENQYLTSSRDPFVNRGFNLRERFNIYASTFLGAIFPIVAFRYCIYPRFPDDLGKESMLWAVSIIINFYPGRLGSVTFPEHGARIGREYGLRVACDLRRKRLRKFNRLEQSAQESILTELV